jgi:PTS system ascorbate-specific IIA component
VLQCHTLKNPVEFGNKDNDPVYYVFMLATTDMESHISALSNLCDLLAKSEFFEVINNSSDSASIIDYIKANEN